MNARTLIEAVVGVVIGLALFPVVSTSTATASVNQTGAIAALLGLLPIVYVNQNARPACC